MATIPISPGELIACSTLFIPVCTFTVALRFYTRRVHKSTYEIDDWLTVPALVRDWERENFLTSRAKNANPGTGHWAANHHDHW